MFCLSTRCLWLALCLPLVVLQPALAAHRKAALRSAKISFSPLTSISAPTSAPTPATKTERRVALSMAEDRPLACRTDGIWYSPLGSRTVETVEGCKSRCKSEGQAYFNSFPNGGCHCASSTAARSFNSGNPTAGSGSVDCSYYYTSTSPNLSCQLLHQITTSSACQEAAAEAGGTFAYNIHYSVWNQNYAGCSRVGGWFFFKGNFATADDFNEIPENRRSVCLVSAMPTPASTPPPSPALSCGAVWTQCGGDGWTGPTCCSGNHVCTRQNAYYSQCL